MDSAGIVLIVGLGAFGVIVGTVALRAWVLSVVWGWFVVPAFGVAPMSVPVAIVVSALVVMLAGDSPRWHDDGDDKGEALRRGAKSIAYAFLQPLIVLLLAWIVRHFFM